MIIAVTSQNFRTITGHAGKARRFIIYKATDADDIVEVERLDLPIEMLIHNHDDSAHPIDVADTLITSDCNKQFIEKMISRNIKVITTAEKDPLNAVSIVIKGERLPKPKPREEVKTNPLYRQKPKLKK